MKLYAATLDFSAISEQLGIEAEFSPQLHAAAAAATDQYAGQRRDARDIPLVTIDPPSSQDLDQAIRIAARDGGFEVSYAIADVAAFMEHGGVLEQESLRRGQTIYLANEPARLHPSELSEGSASLLPDVERPAVLWTFRLDHAGEVEDFHVERALVRSRAKLNYAGVHEDYLAGTLHPSIELLPQVGRLRQQSSLRAAAINLRLPSTSVELSHGEDGREVAQLAIEPRYEVMDYNSEISLLTGMCAGQLMARHGVGLLRTLPPADAQDTAEFVAHARALGFEVDPHAIGQFLNSIDPDTPRGMAVMKEAQGLLRGAGYAWLPADAAEIHAGIGGYYAHVTAPLRRLADRYATEVCLALSSGKPIPAWVEQQIEQVKDTMKASGALASQADKASLALVEAAVLQPWVGHNFTATIMESGAHKARGFIEQPPVMADIAGSPPVGGQEVVTLVQADVDSRQVLFAWPAD